MPEPCNRNPHNTISPKLDRIKKKIFIVANHVPMKKAEYPKSLIIWLGLRLIMNLVILNFTPAFLRPVVRNNVFCMSS